MNTLAPDSVLSGQDLRARIHFWLPMERRSFRKALKKFGPYHWEEISIAMGTRTISEVALYWHDSLHGMTWRRFSKWTNLEKSKFMHALTTSDTDEDWSITAMVGARSPSETNSYIDVIKADLKRIQDAQRTPDRKLLLVAPPYRAGLSGYSGQVASRNLPISGPKKQPSAKSLGVYAMGNHHSMPGVKNQNSYASEASVIRGSEKAEPKEMQTRLLVPSLVRSQSSLDIVDSAGASSMEDPWNYEPKTPSILSIIYNIFGQTEPEEDVDSAIVDKLMEDVLLPLSLDSERSAHNGED